MTPAIEPALFVPSRPPRPLPEAMLCIADLEKFKKVNKGLNKVVVSIKLDGVRCLATREKAGLQFSYFSRNHKKFPNFDCFNVYLYNWAQVLKSKYGLDAVFDGEVIDATGKFTDLMCNVRRLKDADSSGFVYSVFDLAIPGIPFSKRYALLLELERELPSDKVIVHKHGVMNFSSIEEIISLTSDVCAKGHEGLVLKTYNGPYEERRSPHWVKLKYMHTLDLPCVGMIEGTGKFDGMMGALICKHKGKTVNVGTGFNDADRIALWAMRDRVSTSKPLIVEIRYQEETKAGSLRFPAFLRIRDDKDEHDG